MAEGKYSIERLYHFGCGYEDCKGWFSMGDAYIYDRDSFYCPLCGRKQKFVDKTPGKKIEKTESLEGKIETEQS